MATLIQIRNVPEQTRRTLKARAAARGESLNTYVLRLLVQETERPTVDEVLARAAQRTEKLATSSLEALDEVRSERAGREHQQ